MKTNGILHAVEDQSLIEEGAPSSSPAAGVVDPRLIALLRCVRHAQIEIGETILVVGDGWMADAAAQFAHLAGAAQVIRWTPSLQSNAKVDVLIDANSPPARLAAALPQVTVGGRVLVIAVDGHSAADFDLYPDVHRRSLQLLGVSLANQDEPSAAAFAHDVDFVAHLIANGQLVVLAIDHGGIGQP